MSEWPLSKECFVTPVALAAIRKFGLESLDWAPEVLRDAFEEEFDIKRCPQRLFDKLNCGYMLIGTDAFNSTIEGFLSATCIMNNLVFDASEAPFCSLEMCAWSTWEAAILLGDIDNGKSTAPYCPDVIKYIQEVGKLNGVYRFPKWMSFANPENGSMPDLTGDVDAFGAFERRQEAYISDMNGFVTSKQKLLIAELEKLKTIGIL